MKANELRVGNLYNYLIFDPLDERKEWLELTKADGDDIAWLEKNPDDPNYQPITLTEEWLLKFGAIVYDFDHQPNQYRISERLFVTRDGHFYDYGANVKLLYIHQLQNLYFALTGEELTIKETT